MSKTQFNIELSNLLVGTRYLIYIIDHPDTFRNHPRGDIKGDVTCWPITHTHVGIPAQESTGHVNVVLIVIHVCVLKAYKRGPRGLRHRHLRLHLEYFTVDVQIGMVVSYK